MPARRAPRGKTKSIILEAAQRQFARHGFAKVTMDEIADEVGLGKASLYYYYPTKEILFQAVIVNEHNALMKSVESALTHSTSASEQIRTYVLKRFEYFGKLVSLSILDMRSSGKAKPMLRDTFAEFAREELNLLRTIMHAGNDSGEFRVPSVGKAAEAFLHVMQGLRWRFLQIADGTRADPKGYLQLKRELCFVTEIFLRGIQNSTRALEK